MAGMTTSRSGLMHRVFVSPFTCETEHDKLAKRQGARSKSVDVPAKQQLDPWVLVAIVPIRLQVEATNQYKIRSHG